MAYGSGNMGMVGGQVFDIQAENQDIDLPTLQNIHKHKTGMLLIRAAVRMGAIAAGASIGNSTTSPATPRTSGSHSKSPTTC